ncbi:uncharacterized protein LOC121877366 [Homarus americanus]|uniref:uncharacterized protein LOC121877366 n=1 Tax=Homarus americanus TaxID=6706 RepID=UPI001C47523D|nr:uncharacterized protein LOC121877366 [Homarus americanus]
MGGQRAMWALRAVLVLSLGSCLLCVRTSDGSLAGELRRMTKTVVEGEALPRPGASTREREIAAIFRGVAYGAPTTTTAPPTPAAAPGNDQVFKSLLPSAPPPTPGTDSKSYSPRQPTNRTSKVPKIEYEVPSGKKDTSYQVDVVPTYGGDSGTTPGASERVISGSFTTTTTVVLGEDGTIKIDTTVSTADVRMSLGVAWWAHVYVSVVLYTLLAIASLCLMARAAAATRLLPRPHYLTLHFLVFLSAFSRGLYILHDAHAIQHLLPATMLVAVEESGWPCLTAALAVMIVGVVVAWHHPRRPCIALTITLITATHLVSLPVTHFTVGLLELVDLPIMLTTRVATVTWGGAVGVGGMWAVWPARRGHSSHLTDVVGPGHESCLSVSPPAHLVLVGTITQLLLAGINLYVLVVPVSPTDQAWEWWCRLTLSRGLEVVMGGMLLTAAALTISQPGQCCALNCYCCQKRTVEIVHPSAIKMIHPLGVYTLQQARPKNEHAQTIAALSLNNYQKVKRDHKSLDYVTSDFQLVWSHARPLTASQTAGRLDAGDDFLQLRVDKDQDLPRAHILPLTPRKAMKPLPTSEVFTCSLPSYKLYAAAPENCYHFDEETKASLEHGVPHTNDTAVLSSSSDSSKLYSSPQVPLRASRSWDELSTSHIYEEPQRTLCGSMDEGLSDLSDVNGLSDLSDLPTDYLSDILYSDTGSPVMLRPPQRARRRQPVACYVASKQITSRQPLTHVITTHQSTTTTTTPHQTTSQEPTTRQSTKVRDPQPHPLPAGANPSQPTSAQPPSINRKTTKTSTNPHPPTHRPLHYPHPPTQ